MGINVSTFCLTVAGSLWISQSFVWLARVAYQNTGTRAVQFCDFEDEEHFVIIKLLRPAPWSVEPGQYIFITRQICHHRGQAGARPIHI
jgi:hypothetical protein